MGDFFAGKSILITGAASGIGLAMARLLQGRGAVLTLWDVDAARSAAAGAELGVPVATVDICDEAAVRAALAGLERLDGVFHSAGVLAAGAFEDLTPAQHQRLIAVNAGGTVTVVQAVLPLLRASRGSLVLMGSTGGFYGVPDEAVYGATKAFVISLAQALRIELTGSGVHVGVCNPLLVGTPMLSEAVWAGSRLMHSRSPFMHIYAPEAVAQAAARAMERRSFMIFVGLRTRLAWWLSRYGAYMAHRIMRSTWRDGSRRLRGRG